jgi:acyl dehydratase
MNQTSALRSAGWTGARHGAPRVGQAARISRTVTARDIDAFAGMTGDRNPIHFDARLAANTPFGGIVVQGGVTSGLLNALVATHLPGPGTVFLEVGWRFLKAVKPGETITARVEVLSVREDKPVCRLATTITNAAGETVLDGHAVTYTVPAAQG